jgi:hypothetical protein
LMTTAGTFAISGHLIIKALQAGTRLDFVRKVRPCPH